MSDIAVPRPIAQILALPALDYRWPALRSRRRS